MLFIYVFFLESLMPTNILRNKIWAKLKCSCWYLSLSKPSFFLRSFSPAFYPIFSLKFFPLYLFPSGFNAYGLFCPRIFPRQVVFTLIFLHTSFFTPRYFPLEFSPSMFLTTLLFTLYNFPTSFPLQSLSFSFSLIFLLAIFFPSVSLHFFSNH